jgi:histidyl-tRNA synthetase
LPAQFKAAENGGVPFAVILGEEEQAQGKVKLKQMGLPEGHPEKDGVMVDLSDLVQKVKAKIAEQESVESLASRTEAVQVETATVS